MAAIALMALALFSCNKKNEPKTEAVLSIRIDDAQLRAVEDAATTGQQTLVTTNVVLTLDNGEQITLDDAAITAAKSATGYEHEVTHVVKTVSLVANGVIDDNTDIKTLQGKALETEIPLAAAATPVTTTTNADKTVYSVTLAPTPAVARLEVSGEIKGQANAAGVNAFDKIEVKEVYVNNYLSTISGNRYMSTTNGVDGFATTNAPQAEMFDAIPAAQYDEFVAGTKVAGYQLFPKKANETASAPDYFDHVVLKIKITYSAEALAAKPELANLTDRYVTIARFMIENTGDLDNGFESGKIYKLNLGELSKDFKTGDDNTPDPDNPDAPDPEPSAKKVLNVKVEPFTWTAVNIKPDVNGGYKK